MVGPICESGDFLAKDRNLPPLNPGDLVVIKSADTYGFAMSSNYNTRGRVAEVAVKGGEDFLIRRRESFEDIAEERTFSRRRGQKLYGLFFFKRFMYDKLPR